MTPQETADHHLHRYNVRRDATLRESVIEPLAALLEQSRDGLDADTVKQVQAIVG